MRRERRSPSPTRRRPSDVAPSIELLGIAGVTILMGYALMVLPAIRAMSGRATEYAAALKWLGWLMVTVGALEAFLYLRNPRNVLGLWLRFFDSKAGEWFCKLAAIGLKPRPRRGFASREPPEVAMLEEPSYEELQEQRKRKEK